MPQTLEALERQRTKLYEQLQTLGDFRPGTISVNFRKCGKTNCACARKGHKGHGPQYLWNTTQRGQSRAQNLRMGPQLERSAKSWRRIGFFSVCASNWSRSMNRFASFARSRRSRMKRSLRL
jgi:hypothetical protein